jgi:hypothetical protein
VGNPRELSEAEVLDCYLNPTTEDREISRAAQALKEGRPEWWSAMARGVFGEKTAKGQALLMPQALAIQARRIGVRKDGKVWLSADGKFSITL